MHSRFLVPLFCAAAIAFACGPRPHAGEAVASAATPAPLPTSRASGDDEVPVIASSLDVSVKEGVALVFHVTNSGPKAIELIFPNGQTHDFVVTDSVGREVWRWSSDRMFTQALRNSVLDAGETQSYEGRWDPAGRRGTFTAVATLASSNHPLESRVEFAVP